MAWLNRDKTPALFAVTTSVVALVSAIVALVFWAAFALRPRKGPARLS